MSTLKVETCLKIVQHTGSERVVYSYQLQEPVCFIYTPVFYSCSFWRLCVSKNLRDLFLRVTSGLWLVMIWACPKTNSCGVVISGCQATFLFVFSFFRDQTCAVSFFVSSQDGGGDCGKRCQQRPGVFVGKARWFRLWIGRRRRKRWLRGKEGAGCPQWLEDCPC